MGAPDTLRSVVRRDAVADGLAPRLSLAATILLLPVWTVALMVSTPVGEDSDGLVETLASLHKLTVFFWDQDRFANLLPALTIWLREPVWNAWAQLFLRILSGLVSPLLVAALVFPDALAAWSAVLVADAILALTLPQVLVFNVYAEASPYGTSFACLGLAVLLLRRAGNDSTGRVLLQAAAFVLVVAGFMVNISLLLCALPLILMCLGVFGGPAVARLALFCALACAISLIAMHTLGRGDPTASGVDFTLHGAAVLAAYLGNADFRLCPVVAVAIIVVASLLLHLAGLRREARSCALAGGIAIISAAFWFLAAAFSRHVGENQFHIRYLIPSYLLVAAGCGVCCVLVLNAPTRHRVVRLLPFALGIVGLSSVLVRPGGDGSGGIIADHWAASANAVAAVAVSRSINAIAGSYWEVWPSVFDTEQLLYRRNEPTDGIFGLTLRGRVRRRDFLRQVYAGRHFTVGCIGITLDACGRQLRSTVGVANLSLRQPTETVALPDGQILSIAQLEVADSGNPSSADR